MTGSEQSSGIVNQGKWREPGETERRTGQPHIVIHSDLESFSCEPGAHGDKLGPNGNTGVAVKTTDL